MTQNRLNRIVSALTLLAVFSFWLQTSFYKQTLTVKTVDKPIEISIKDQASDQIDPIGIEHNNKSEITFSESFHDHSLIGKIFDESMPIETLSDKDFYNYKDFLFSLLINSNDSGDRSLFLELIVDWAQRAPHEIFHKLHKSTGSVHRKEGLRFLHECIARRENATEIFRKITAGIDRTNSAASDYGNTIYHSTQKAPDSGLAWISDIEDFPELEEVIDSWIGSWTKDDPDAVAYWLSSLDSVDLKQKDWLIFSFLHAFEPNTQGIDDWVTLIESQAVRERIVDYHSNRMR